VGGSDEATGASVRRSGLAGGCALLIGIVAAVVALAFWLWVEIENRPAAGESDPAPRARDGQLSRPERRALEDELERVERDLAFARGQMYAHAEVATRAAWRARVDELTTRRDELRDELGR
jgi:hypothetical protein